MNKVAIICKLHEIADHYLLGSGSWPGTSRFTALGKEMNLD